MATGNIAIGEGAKAHGNAAITIGTGGVISNGISSVTIGGSDNINNGHQSVIMGGTGNRIGNSSATFVSGNGNIIHDVAHYSLISAVLVIRHLVLRLLLVWYGQSHVWG